MTLGPQPPPIPIPRRSPRGPLVVALIAVGVILAIIGGFVIWRWRLHRAVDSRIAAIHAAGLPTSWNELNDWPARIPNSENGALIYLSVMEKLVPDQLYETRNYLPRRGQAISNELRVTIEQDVVSNQAVLDFISSATNFQKFQYPLDFSAEPKLPLPHLGALNEVVRLLAGDAVVKCDAGAVRAAGRDIETSFRVAQTLDGEPVLLSQYSAGRMLVTSCQSLERILCRTALDDRTLAEIQKEMIAAEATNRFWLGSVGQRAIDAEIIRVAQDDPQGMLDKLTDNSSSDQGGISARNVGFMSWLFGIFERDRIFYLDMMQTNIVALKVMPPASLLVTNQADGMSEEARRGFYIFSSLLLSEVSGVAVRDATVRASLRTAIAAAAVERWRLAHDGALPDSLNDLVPTCFPAVPADPFDGNPLRFKKLPRGFVIYSIGPDQKDDGGLEQLPWTVKASQEQRNKYDITFTVER